MCTSLEENPGGIYCLVLRTETKHSSRFVWDSYWSAQKAQAADEYWQLSGRKWTTGSFGNYRYVDPVIDGAGEIIERHFTKWKCCLCLARGISSSCMKKGLLPGDRNDWLLIPRCCSSLPLVESLRLCTVFLIVWGPVARQTAPLPVKLMKMPWRAPSGHWGTEPSEINEKLLSSFKKQWIPTVG